MSSSVTLALIVAVGLACGWGLIVIIWNASRGFRKVTRVVACKCGFHAPSGQFVPAVGGRDVMRCLYCDEVVYEVKRSKESLRRTS